MRNFRKKNRRPWPPVDDSKEFRVNDQIQADTVRVIDGEEGGMLGVMTLKEALAFAESKEMDLVEINPKGEPPVCKLIEWTKFKYQQEKNEHKAKAKEDKTIRLSVRVAVNILEVRGKQAEGFLEKGHKVKLQIQMKGREKAYPEVAKETLENFITYVNPEKYALESELKQTGDSYFAYLKPKK
jgi:translation initiation factor IF-3